MLKILHASSTQTLLDDLVARLCVPGDPAARRSVLLPSRPLVERVHLALARRAGLAMGCDLLLPGDFSERVALALGLPPLDPGWTADGLFWRVLRLLPGVALRHPRRLRESCADLGSRTALAREVADRFDQYLHFRPDLIRAWDLGLPLNEYLGRRPELKAVFQDGFSEQARRDEAWQLDLWRDLAAAAGGAEHPARRLDQLAALAGERPVPGFGPAVEALATGPLPFPLLTVLKALGRRLEVRLRVLLPANGYLADLEPRWRQWTRGEAADLEAEGHPLLAQMGRQSVEFFRGLDQLSDAGQEFEALAEALPRGDGLLARIQADVRSLRQPDPGERPVSETPAGGSRPLRSLRVHRCYGARREVEALRDELLRAFAELPDLRPEEVLVLAPDLDVYGPLAQTVLARGAEPRLPLRLAERRVERADGRLKALLALLDLAAGRGALSDLLGFLDLPAVRASLGDGAARALAGSLDAAGLTFGFDAPHRAALGCGDDATGTWRFGLDRLGAGLLLGDEEGALDASGAAALPLAGDLGGGGREVLDGLAWFERLLGTLVAWREPAPPEAWGDRLTGALEGLLAPAFPDDEATLGEEVAQALRRAGQVHGCDTPLDALVVAAAARAMAGEERREVAQVGGHIALGGLKPLRALPCRVLALVGLGDAAFPRGGETRAWDLLAALPLPGDRDPRKDDRQLFLDCLLAAADRLIITAPARGLHNDQSEPLSVCVEDLLRSALDTVGVDGAGRGDWVRSLVVDHALQPFSPRAFDGREGRDRSFDAAALELARRLASPRRERPFAAAGCRAPESGTEDTLEALQSFLNAPARVFLGARGMDVPRDAEDPLERDDEPAGRGAGLRNWLLGEGALQACLERGPCALERLGADRLLPLGRLGRLAGAEALDRAEALAEAIRKAAGGDPQPRPCRVRLKGGRTLTGALARAGPEGRYGIWRPHGLEATSAGPPNAGAKLLAWAWLRACLAAAAGDMRPGFLASGTKDGGCMVVCLPVPGAEGARAVLGRLWEIRDEARSECPPYSPETSLALARALGAGKDPWTAAEAAWEGGSGSWGESSDPALALAWRGRPPFDGGLKEAWMGLAREIWEPVLAWWQGAAAEGQGRGAGA